jgi:hypothetical protein
VSWDSSRAVPWKRLVKEWLIYVGIMAVVFVAVFRDRSIVGLLGGLLISGPLYLVIGYVLAKIGYQRKTLRQARAESRTPRHPGTDVSAPRPKPAPTKRTGGGGNTRPISQKRRK